MDTHPPAAPVRPDEADLYRLLVEHVRDYAVFLLDLDGRVASWNAGAERILGYRESEIVGRPGSVIFTPEDVRLGAPEQELRQALATGRAEDDRWHVRKDGTRFWASGVLVAIRDEAGTLRAFAKILRDLTGRKLAEDELSRRAVMLDQAHEAIVAWTWGGPITFWNRGAEELYGFAREEAVGHVVHQLLQTGPAEAVDRSLAALARDGRWEGELEHVRRDGRRVVVETRQVLVRETGQAYVLEANRDVTERRALESLQHEFLASVSHDLKNPLATIKGQAQLLRRRLDRGAALDVDQLRSGLEAIGAAATRASSQVDELLDVALVRAGRPLDLHPEPVDLVALARRLVAEYQQTTDRHTLRVEATAPALVGEWDPRRLERVVANLLANAIKYSPAGGDVTVRVAAEDGPDGPRALLTVADQGVGIPAADLPHVFERFRRGANVGGIAGTGVGLAAACRIVEQHGGTIGVESQEAAGSRFTIRLPRVEAHG